MATDNGDTVQPTESTTPRKLVLVTAGQLGSGKSTLVKNLLGFSGNDAEAPKACQSATTVMKKSKAYDNHDIQIKDRKVNVTIVDTPGLAGAPDQDPAKIIADMVAETKGKADVLLYCASVSPSSRLGEVDVKIIKALTEAFTPKIWEKTVLVFTFADYVQERNLKKPRVNPTVEYVMKDYAEEFQRLLAKSTGINTFKVVPLAPNRASTVETKQPPTQITAVPAGEDPGEEILPNMKWDEYVHLEALKKFDPDSVPALLKVTELSQVKFWGLVGGGAAVGYGAGLAVGGVGAIPGAIGGAVGGAVGGAGGYLMHKATQDNKEIKLEKIHKEIKKKAEQSDNTKKEK